MLTLGSPFRAIARLVAFLLLTAAVAPLQLVALTLGSSLAARLPRFFHRRCCGILGLQVECRGRPNAQRPTLFACNHTSYTDILVLGSLLTGSFVAKADVAQWPFFGTLARLQRTVFVDRRRSTTGNQRDELRRRLEAGDNLILFPEGTSNDGNRVLPFRSALFGAAEVALNGRPLPVQPVSVAYTRLDGVPLGYGLRALVAWYGDMDLVGHLLRLVGLGKVTAVVTFHEPVTIRAFGSRKSLAEHCFAAVASGVAAALSGRPQPPAQSAGLPGPAGESDTQRPPKLLDSPHDRKTDRAQAMEMPGPRVTPEG
jgi:1-acyl-sn-glycerol-3-phosphate acyltransferase